MEEIRYNNAIVRIHGAGPPPQIEEATIRFLKRVERKRRENEKRAQESCSRISCGA